MRCLCDLRVSAEDGDDGEAVRVTSNRLTAPSRECDASVARRAGARLPGVKPERGVGRV